MPQEPMKLRKPKARRVLVCGLPFSGNRLVKGLAETAGIIARVFHGAGVGTPRGAVIQGVGGPDYRAIIPVRDPRIWNLSCQKNGPSSGKIDEDRYRMDVVRDLADAQIPVVFIPYESILRDPVWVGKYLWRFLGVEPPPDADAETLWGQEIVDGDAKYMVQGASA